MSVYHPGKQKVRMLSVDVNCLGCDNTGKIVRYYNPGEEVFEPIAVMERRAAKQPPPSCERCGGKQTLKISQTPDIYGHDAKDLN